MRNSEDDKSDDEEQKTTRKIEKEWQVQAVSVLTCNALNMALMQLINRMREEMWKLIYHVPLTFQ